VTVASGHPAVVSAWLGQLANLPGLRVAGAHVSDPQKLDESLGASKPHVLLLDVGALEWLSAKALEQLRARDAGLRVLLVCDGAGPQLVELVLRHHLEGYLVSCDRRDLYLKAIRAVSRGELWLPRAALAEALYLRCGYREDPPAARQAKGSARWGPLTEREREIARCLGKGSTNMEIAKELGIKKDTVKKHLRSVFGKLGVRRRAQVALLHGAVEPQGPLAARSPGTQGPPTTPAKSRGVSP
jgi:DNA-binding NarL/FixJ family response regulator